MRIFLPYDKKTIPVEVADQNFVGSLVAKVEDYKLGKSQQEIGGQVWAGNRGSRADRDACLHRRFRHDKSWHPAVRRRMHREPPANETEFQPGEKAQTSGVYDVVHDKIDGEHHAHQHQVIVAAGTVFPRCKGCRQWVKFRLAQQAEFIDKDSHFER